MHDVVYSYKRLSPKHRALCTVCIRNLVFSDFHPILHDQTVHSGNKSILRCPLWAALVPDFRLTSCWSRSISLVLLSNQKHSLFSAYESCLLLFHSPRSPNNTTPCETSAPRAFSTLALTRSFTARLFNRVTSHCTICMLLGRADFNSQRYFPFNELDLSDATFN